MKTKVSILSMFVSFLLSLSIQAAHAASPVAQDQVFYDNTYACASQALVHRDASEKELAESCAAIPGAVSDLELKAIRDAIKDNGGGAVKQTPPTPQKVSAKPPMEVSIMSQKTDGPWGAHIVYYVRVTSVVDAPLNVTDIQVNRNTCAINHPYMTADGLGYGQYHDFIIGQCVAREVVVKSNQGDWVFTVNQ